MRAEIKVLHFNAGSGLGKMAKELHIAYRIVANQHVATDKLKQTRHHGIDARRATHHLVIDPGHPTHNRWNRDTRVHHTVEGVHHLARFITDRKNFGDAITLRIAARSLDIEDYIAACR